MVIGLLRLTRHNSHDDKGSRGCGVASDRRGQLTLQEIMNDETKV